MRDNSLGVDSFVQVYNGTYYPNVQKYTVGPPVVRGGFSYTFKVQAINYNGAGSDSTLLTYSVCVPPSGLFPPTLSAVTKTSMTLTWVAPNSDGGCPITSYYIYIDDGAGGSLAVIDNSTIYGKPTIRTHTITSFTGSDTSKTFKV